MRRTMTAEVRLDRGKATGSGIARRAIRRLADNGVGCNRNSLPRASMRRKITPDESGIRGMSAQLAISCAGRAAAMREPCRKVGLFVIRYRTLALALICLLAIAVRVANRAYAGSADFWQNGYIFYYDFATNIAAGKGLSIDGGSWAMRPPIYPCFLALAALAGGHYMLIVVPQAMFGAGTAFCAYLIGNELFSQRTGMIAALLTALYPYYVVHDTALQETGMVTFSATLAVYLLLRTRNSQSVAGWLAAGIVLGLSVLIRTTMFPFALAAVAWIAIFGEGQKLLRASVVFVALLVAVAAWMERNYLVVGRPVLTSEFGIQFWSAHNPQTFSHYPVGSIDRSYDAAVEALTPSEQEEMAALSANELAQSDWFLHRGLAYIEANPGAALTGALRKVAAGFSWVISPRREPLVQMTYILSYAPISILGLLGMVLGRRAWRVHSLIYLQFLAFVVVSGIFWAHTSHRTYLDVYLIVFSVFAAERLSETICRVSAKTVG
jgi:Dolichyl-phosphate-mannose-protein mannosyltransferase